MARGNTMTAQKWCSACGRKTRAERNSMVIGAGDLVVLLLAAFVGFRVAQSSQGVLVAMGVAAGAKALVGFATNPWRCGECGKRL